MSNDKIVLLGTQVSLAPVLGSTVFFTLVYFSGVQYNASAASEEPELWIQAEAQTFIIICCGK